MRTRHTPRRRTDRSVGTFTRIGVFSVRHRRAVVVGWLAVAIVMGAFARGLEGRLGQGGFDVPGSDSNRVATLLASRFEGQSTATALVVVQSSSLAVTSPPFRATLAGIVRRVSATPGVAGVQSLLSTAGPTFVSPDRHTTYLVAALRGSQNRQLLTAARVQANAARGVPAAFRVDTGGGPAFYNRLTDISKADLTRAETVSFPVTLAVLLIAFSSLVAAGIPVLLALLSLIVTLGALYFLAGVLGMSVYVTNTASIIGIGVGIDYALFVVTRFREELRRGREVPDAVVASIATSGRAVALSGTTVALALAGMFLIDMEAFRSMAIGSMAVVAVAVIAALTLLPAVLSYVGPAVDRLAIPLVTARPRADGRGMWHRWAMGIMRRPWTFALASLTVLVLLAAPLLSIRLGQSGPRILPPAEGPRVATQELAAAFGPGVTGPVEILVRTPGDAASPAGLAAVQRLVERLRADPQAARIEALTTLVPRATLATYQALYAHGPAAVPPALRPAAASLADWNHGARISLVVVQTRSAPESAPAEAFVKRLRADEVPAAGLAGRALVGGTTAFDVDLENDVAHHLPIVVGSVLALSFLLLVSAFRSLFLPLKAIVMNMLSVGAAYGIIVAVFQWGWLSHLLRFTPDGTIEVFVPLFLFSMLFGLSMDYEVFLMSRIREEWVRTGDNELAVARGLEGSGRTITSAALVMVTVFAAFASSRLIIFKELGLGLAVAVAVDATIVRTVLVPAVMKLMGRWNWWMPRWLDRALPSIGLEAEAGDRQAGGR